MNLVHLQRLLIGSLNSSAKADGIQLYDEVKLSLKRVTIHINLK